MTATEQGDIVEAKSTPMPDDTPITPEVVETRADVERVETPQRSAIERAAEAALSEPGIPGRDEFLSLAAQARILCMSAAAPPAVKNNPHLAFHIAMIGRDLRISPSAALEQIDVIAKGENDANPKLSLSPQLLNGQIRRLGLGRIVRVSLTDTSCVAAAIGPRDLDPNCGWPVKRDTHVEGCACDVLGTGEYTWDDAMIARLVDERCPDPKHHWRKAGTDGKNYNDRCDCRGGWLNYPRRMLWWRTSGFVTDDFFPEAGLGLYTAEELGAVVDVDGRPVDPSTVELPAGYEPPPPPPPPPPADLDELWSLQERINALPTQERDDLRARWQQSRLKGRNVSRLQAGDVQLAKSMVAGFESIAKRGGWNLDEAVCELRQTLARSVVAAFGATIVDDASEAGSTAESTPETSQDDSTPDAAPDHLDAPDERTATDPAESATSPPDDRVQAVIAEVQAMASKDVTAALRARSLPATGNDPARRRRLAEAMLAAPPLDESAATS